MAIDTAKVVTTPTYYVVCHANDLFSDSKWPIDYDAKAIVVAATLDDVFGFTNNTDVDWCCRDNVTLLANGPIRSTSVGDVVIKVTSQPFLCENVGWRALAKANRPLPTY